MHSASAVRATHAGANCAVHPAQRRTEKPPLHPLGNGQERPLSRFGDGGQPLLPWYGG